MLSSPALPQLPHEIVTEIATFIPRAIDKYSHTECRKHILNLRHKSARKLRNVLLRFYIEDWDELEPQKKEEYKTIDQEYVLWSAEPDNMSETLSMLSSFILESAGWNLNITDIWKDWGSPIDCGLRFDPDFRWTPQREPPIFNERWYNRLRRVNRYSVETVIKHVDLRLVPYL